MSADSAPPELLPTTVPPEFVTGGADWAAAFSPDVHRVMDVRQRACVALESEVCCAAFAPDSARVAVGRVGGVSLYGVDGEGRIDLDLNSPSYPRIASVAFSPDNTLLAAGADDSLIRVWHLPSGAPAHTLAGHHGAISAVAFAADSASVLSASADGSLRVWPLSLVPDYYNASSPSSSDPGDADAECVILTPAVGLDAPPLTALARSPDGHHAAIGSADGAVALWDLRAHARVAQWRAHAGEVFALAWGRAGLLSGGRDGALVRWDTERAPEATQDGEGVARGARMMRHAEFVLAAAAAQLGQLARAAVGTRDGRLQLWDPRAGALMFCVIGHRHSVTAVDLSADGGMMVSGSGDGEVRIWSYSII